MSPQIDQFRSADDDDDAHRNTRLARRTIGLILQYTRHHRCGSLLKRMMAACSNAPFLKQPASVVASWSRYA